MASIAKLPTYSEKDEPITDRSLASALKKKKLAAARRREIMRIRTLLNDAPAGLGGKNPLIGKVIAGSNLQDLKGSRLDLEKEDGLQSKKRPNKLLKKEPILVSALKRKKKKEKQIGI